MLLGRPSCEVKRRLRSSLANMGHRARPCNGCSKQDRAPACSRSAAGQVLITARKQAKRVCPVPGGLERCLCCNTDILPGGPPVLAGLCELRIARARPHRSSERKQHAILHGQRQADRRVGRCTCQGAAALRRHLRRACQGRRARRHCRRRGGGQCAVHNSSSNSSSSRGSADDASSACTFASSQSCRVYALVQNRVRPEHWCLRSGQGQGLCRPLRRPR